MKLNAWFPTVQIGSDPAAIRDWAQAAEDLGYEYIEVPDHVLGATGRDGWEPRYAADAPFHETSPPWPTWPPPRSASSFRPAC